jgi:alpha-tubulin suppressor-like RCC1 family protein
LGDGTTSDHSTPVAVNGLSGAQAIAAGELHSAALKADGTVWTWGANLLGQLGDGTTTAHLTPIQVQGLSGVTAIAAGEFHSLALTSDGAVWAWGENYLGRLGNGTWVMSAVPVQPVGMSGVRAIAAGANNSLAVKSDGTVWAWGANASGQLGIGTTGASCEECVASNVPVQVKGLDGVQTVAAGYAHALALKADGTVWAWGANASGQLGTATTASTIPVQVGGLSGVRVIAGRQPQPGPGADAMIRPTGLAREQPVQRRAVRPTGCGQLAELLPDRSVPPQRDDRADQAIPAHNAACRVRGVDGPSVHLRASSGERQQPAHRTSGKDGRLAL